MNTVKDKVAARIVELSLGFELDDLPWCCGARVMGDFEIRCRIGTRTVNVDSWYAESTPKQREAALEGAVAPVKLAIERLRETSGDRQIVVVATTVHDPYSKIRTLKEKVLELAGMKCVKTWVNSNTANTLNMWVSGD